MIGAEAFGQLRLRHFLAREDITELSNWKFQGEYWVGEADGFTEFLRLESDPDVVRSIALDLAELPEPACQSIFGALGIQMTRGMSAQDVVGLLGRPSSEKQFPQAKDRVTQVFRLYEPSYEVSCTVHESKGLVYAVISSLAPRPKRRRHG